MKLALIIFTIVYTGAAAQIAPVDRTSKGNLSPQLYNSIKDDSIKLDVLLQQHKGMMGIVDKIANRLDFLQPIIVTNTEHLKTLDTRMTIMEQRFDKHESLGQSDPVSIARLQTKLESVSEDVLIMTNIGKWIVITLSGLLVTLITIVLKFYVEKKLPPAWAALEAAQQKEYREQTMATLANLDKKTEITRNSVDTINAKIMNERGH